VGVLTSGRMGVNQRTSSECVPRAVYVQYH
jgi:hypothetical protein